MSLAEKQYRPAGGLYCFMDHNISCYRCGTSLAKLSKARLNFCDWFVASETAFDATGKEAEDQAKTALDALFDD